MSNRNVEFFRNYLRVLGATVSYVEAARNLSISEAWVYKCLSASKVASATPDAPSVFLFEAEEGDGEPRWFHDHVRYAVTNSIEAIEAAARCRALHGTWVPAMYKGESTYKRDPALIGKPWLVDLLGLDDDLLRDPKTGLPQPEMTFVPAPVDLIGMVLSAHSKRYRKAVPGGNNVQVNLQNGVQVIPRKPGPQISAPLPVLEIVQDAIPERGPSRDEAEADFSEIDDDIAVSDTADAPTDENDDAEPATPAPSPVSFSTPTPPELAPGLNPLITPRSGRRLSDLERDLLSKLPSSLNRKV